MAERLTRDQVPHEQTWNLAHIFPDDAAWSAAAAAVEAGLETVTRYQGRLGQDAAELLAALQARDALQAQLVRVGAYAMLSSAGNGANPTADGQLAQAQALSARVDAALAFFRTELAALPAGTLGTWLAADAKLAVYRRQLELIERDRPHLLAPETERTLAALGDVLQAPATIWRQATTLDLQCPTASDVHGVETPVSIARYVFGLGQSHDRALRRSAHQALATGLKQHQATLAANLALQIRRNVTLARLRGFPSAVHMILHQQDVPATAYRAVLNVIHDEGAVLTRRLVRLRQRVLGLETVYRHDLEAPLDPDFNPTATFDASAAPIIDAVAVFGGEYQNIIAAAFANRWVDWADNIGKRSGAFCSSVYGVHPYVLTTWQGRLRDRFILAHELGHAVHGVLAGRHQVISNTRSSLFFIEAPSTLMELLLGTRMLQTERDPRLRPWIIMQLLGTFSHNMVTHLLEARFEQRLYDLAEADTPLTLATIRRAQRETFTAYYGGTVTLTDEDELYWAQQPHFYYGLYPYTYSAGLACAVAVAQAIATEGEPAAERWLATLRAGGTRSPVDLAAMAGVDLTSATTLRQAVGYFGRLVDELEAAFA